MSKKKKEPPAEPQPRLTALKISLPFDDALRAATETKPLPKQPARKRKRKD